MNVHALAACGLEVLQVLSQRALVELLEERGRCRRVVRADLVDQLTFVHGTRTFRMAECVRAADASAREGKSDYRMPELEPQSQTRKTGADDDLGPDPLASLHKMSTTAGVGSQEYVAINTFAVTSAVLGLATAFAFIGTIFLVIPAAAIVCGILAIRQINDSNGTQGGKWLAVLGIVLALAIAGIVGGQKLAEIRRERDIARQVTDVIDRLGKHLIAGEYDQAYALADAALREIVTREQWAQTWKLQQSPEYNGHVTSLRGNNITSLQVQEGKTYAYTQAILNFEKRPDEVRATLIFSQDDAGQWRLNRIVQMFHPQLKARGINPDTSTPLIVTR